MFKFPLVKKFTLILLLSLLVFGFSIGKIMSSAMRQNMITRSNEITAYFLEHEVCNHLLLDEFIMNRSTAGYEALSRRMAQLNLGPNATIDQVKIWNSERAVVWSSDEHDVGEKNLDKRKFDTVLNGKTISSLSHAHTWLQSFGILPQAKQILDIMVPVRLKPYGDVDLVLEVSARVEELMTDIAYHNQIIWLSLLSGSLLLYLLLYNLFWGAARQIQEQNKAITLSEERYRNLIQAAQDGIISADTSGRILLMNEAAELIFGYAPDDTGNLHFENFFTPDDNDDLRAYLDAFFQSRACSTLGKNFESNGRRSSGETFPLEISLSVSGVGVNCILTGLVRDISLRNGLFEQIEKAKDEWEECFDTINDAITIHDDKFNITRANRAAEKMLGKPMKTILSQKCFRCYHGTGEPPSNCPSCESLLTGTESTTEVFEPFLDKHLEVKALPRLNDENKVVGLVHVVRDITDRKKAEERQGKLQMQLNQSQKMESVGRLAGGIAHDFNNLLTVIIGYSEILQKEIPPDSKAYQDVKTIKETGEKAAVLTGQLLAFSRKQVLNMRPIDLNKVIEELVRILVRVIGEDITLDLHLNHSIGVVVADPGQIEQVLLNLAVNARDAMPKGGHCIIETSMVDIGKEYVDHHAEAQLGAHVLMAFTDTGTGIEKKIRERIFDPFFTTKEVGKGTGLGLATVYGIIKQHGGQIFVYSELGKGTTFKIYLPVTPNAHVTAENQSKLTIAGGDETILIAEDDTLVREMIKKSLEPEGYTILLAANGMEAVEVSNSYEGEIHLLLTDVIMPKLNGQALADILTTQRAGLKVLFMSGYTDDVVAHHNVLNSGVNFIQKPISLSRLMTMIREVIDRKE